MLFDCRRTPLTRTSCASVPSVQLDMGNIFKHYNVLEAEKYSLTLMHKAPDAPLGPHGKVRRRGAAVGVVSRPAAGAASAVVRWFFFFCCAVLVSNRSSWISSHAASVQLQMEPMEIYTVKLKLSLQA